MPKFIKLKDEDGDEIAVNVDMITKIEPEADDELTGVYLVDEEDPVLVHESMDEILAKVAA
jgi:hypothetical protein